MKLIIAEKPSLGRNIAAGIGEMKRRDGYLEGQGYLITWALGHLFTLCDIEDYAKVPPEKGENGKIRWTMENIPCFPDRFRYKLRKNDQGQADAGVAKQLGVIRTLCNRDDVDGIIHAGDADREGEIIVRLCILNALRTQKPVYRLWLPGQTPGTVAKQLAEMKADSDYDCLANEGFARTYIDWLYGVNLTRFATLKSGKFLRVGRVIVPIVKAIYDRDMAIKNFVPSIYYGVESDAQTKGETVTLTAPDKFQTREEAQALCDRFNRETAVVTSKKQKKGTLQPGKLFSLSKLQSLLGKKYKMPMDRSLSILQTLYEEGYVTYPRTNSEYLATAEKEKIKQILGRVEKLGYPVAFIDKKSIFDDSKIESHSALTPTYKIPDKGRLSEEQALVYSTIFRRFVAVFCKETCTVDHTEITIRLGEGQDAAEFSLKGSVIREAGWTKYDDCSRKDKILPPLEKGDVVNIDFKPVEKETSPPKHYTIETLNQYLKNPFREEKAEAKAAEEGAEGEEDDREEYRAMLEGLELGTEATRTGIIDNARKSGYIQLKKDVYTILPDGEFLIRALSMLGISMDKHKTAGMGKTLKQIYKGQKTIQDGVYEAESLISGVFDVGGVPLSRDTDIGLYRAVVGKCPRCGSDVIRGIYHYGCADYKNCDFRIWLEMAGRVISFAQAKQLLENGRTCRIDGFRSRAGKLFSAPLKLEDGKAVFDFGSAKQNSEI